MEDKIEHYEIMFPKRFKITFYIMPYTKQSEKLNEHAILVELNVKKSFLRKKSAFFNENKNYFFIFLFLLFLFFNIISTNVLT